MSAPLSTATLSTVPVSDVHVEAGQNARFTDQQDLQALRASIARHGVLQPLLVRSREQGGVWLVAGHRRFAAALGAGLAEVPVVAVGGDRLELAAVENLQRVALTPLEEAFAFRALADAGQTPRGIAEALGVARRRVTERLAILELTDAGQRAAGDGSLPLSAVALLVELTRLSGALADRVLAFVLKEGDAIALVRDPGWVVSRAVSWEDGAAGDNGGGFEWLALRRRIPLTSVAVGDPELVAAAERVARITFEPAGVRLDEERIAQAVAARCAWVDARGAGVIGRDWLAAQAGALIGAELAQLEAERVQRGGVGPGGGGAAGSERGGDAGDRSAARAAGDGGDGRPQDPAAQARADERAQAAEDRRRAAAVNDELGARLLKGLASAPWDRDAALFVAHTLLERGDGSPYGAFTNTAVLAAQGLRYVLAELRDETPATQPGGQPKVGYPDPREAERRFWAWFERAQSPEEILGRLLVAYAAAAHAREEVVARSHRHGHFRPSPAAQQAFGRLCRRHLPVSLKRFAAELEARAA